MKKPVAIMSTCILLSFMYGCGTVKNLNSVDGYPYGGLKEAATFKGPCNVDTVCLLYYPIIIIASPFIVADIALSAVGDTVTYTIAKSIETKRINELNDVSGIYIHNGSDCYVSINLEKNSSWYKSGQRALFEIREKTPENKDGVSCEFRKGNKNCLNSFGEWKYNNDEIVIDYGNRIILSLVRNNGKVTDIVSKENEIYRCNSIVNLQKQ